MNDYTKALHQRFYREPENTEEEQAMEQAEQALDIAALEAEALAGIRRKTIEYTVSGQKSGLAFTCSGIQSYEPY